MVRLRLRGMKMRNDTRFSIAFIIILILCMALLPGCHKNAGVQEGGSGQPAQQEADAQSGPDDIIGGLFTNQESNVQVKDVGTVIRLLDDDEVGDRHQRFILELESGQTLLVAHNIDIAPRLDGLAVGDTVGFYGEYIYSDKGGTIHWTHHDPRGRHVSGWLEWNGERYK